MELVWWVFNLWKLKIERGGGLGIDMIDGVVRIQSFTAYPINARKLQ